MCVFPVIVYYAAHGKLDLPVLVFLALLFVCGIWAVLSSLFRLDADGALSWIVGAVVSLGFAVFAFSVAWRWKEGWSGIPFIPAAWNSIIARILFAFGGFLAMVSAVVFLRKARKRYRKNHDDVA